MAAQEDSTPAPTPISIGQGNFDIFKVPAKKTSAYKAIFQAKGAGKKIKVKKQ